MVRLTVVLNGINYKRLRFLDSLRLHVKGGTGGMGYPKLGGVGGKGGDVYVRATQDLTLKHILDFHPKKRVIGLVGEDSRKNRILGRPGEPTIINVPVGISVHTELQNCIGTLDAVGEKVLVARGGSGGNQWNQYNGQKGQMQTVILDLKLIADIGFVGFPNAGKSTILKALSRASPKIANYPFTTLRPNIGVMMYDDLRQISLADLPGLIEGAHANVGLGHRFLKHVERTKMLMFVVDVQGFSLHPQSTFRSPFETIMLLNKELELYEDDLVRRPAILVVTKLDTEGAQQKYEKLLNQLANRQAECDRLPIELQPNDFVNFDCVMPVSAKSSFNMPRLKEKLRTLLDINSEIQAATSYAQLAEMESPGTEVVLI